MNKIMLEVTNDGSIMDKTISEARIVISRMSGSADLENP